MPNPTVLVADDEPANRLFVAAVLAAAQWDVIEAADGHEAIARAYQDSPDLVVMDIDMPNVDGWAATQAIRTASAPIASVPILAYTSMSLEDDDVRARGMDGRLPKPCTPDALRDAIAPWRPNGALAGAERLADLFGAERMDELVARFRGQLLDALALLDAESDQVPAHRIAGVAGTLGFADVSKSWLLLSEGDENAREAARRDARLAVAGIDRKYEVAANG